MAPLAGVMIQVPGVRAPHQAPWTGSLLLPLSQINLFLKKYCGIPTKDLLLEYCVVNPWSWLIKPKWL